MDSSSQEISEFSKVSDKEWKHIMPLYRVQQSEWFMVPNFIWVMLIIFSITAIYLLQNYWGIAAAVIGFYSSAQLGSRSGNIDGFQIGYEWGKEQAIMQAYNISSEQLNDITKENNEIKHYANSL